MGERFLIEVSYSDEELAAFRKIVEREYHRGGENLAWGVYATGFLVALIGSLAAFYAGSAPARGADFVAVLIFASFFIGMWSPAIWYRRHRGDRMRAWAWRGSLLVTANGLSTRRPGARGFYSRSAVKGVTIEGGSLLVWIRDGQPLGFPARLLDADQKARMAALATAPN